MIFEIIFKIIGGVIATTGFGILFKVKQKHLPVCAVLGLVACVSYFGFENLLSNEFISNMISAFLVAGLSEIFAKVCKAPATVFLLPGCIALVPGGSLYYTMYNIVLADYSNAVSYLLVTVEVGLGIGSGIIIASFIKYVVDFCLKKITFKDEMSN